MFDIGFSELVLIAIVALVVVGPERLPRVARTAGLLLGRLQRYVGDIKADIHREIELDELKRLQADMQASARDLERSMASVRESVQLVERSSRHALAEAGDEIRALTGDIPGRAIDEMPQTDSDTVAETGESPLPAAAAAGHADDSVRTARPPEKA